MSQQPPIASPIEAAPALEFCSPSGRVVAQLTSRPDDRKPCSPSADPNAPPPQRLEIWGTEGSGGIGCSFCLPAPHGIPWLPPYGGGCFCPKEENLFAYVAEAAPAETKGHLDGFLYKDTWGEQLLQHSKGSLFLGSVVPSFLTSIEPRDHRASYAQVSFVPDGSALVCTEFPAGPYRLGLKFCVNRRASIMLAWFPAVGVGGVSAALREREAMREGFRKPLRASWLAISGDDDWAAWSARVLDIPTERQGPLLSFDVVYLALTADSKQRRPHFGNVQLRIATVVRQAPGAPWGVQSRRTILGPRAPWGPSLAPHCCEAPNGEAAASECRSCCVAGPLRSTEGSTEVDHRAFGGLYTLDLPQWRSREFVLANTYIGCRQTIVAVRTEEAVSRPIVRRVFLEKPQNPSVSAEIKAAAAAAAVGEMSLRDTRGPWMLIQTSSPVQVPVLVLAKLRTTSFTEDTNPEEHWWGPPLMADIVDAFSLRGPQDAFDGAIKKLQLHMLTLSLYHLDCQRHWLLRLGRPPKGPEMPSLAVVIHGGPHACFGCMYSRDVLFLTTLGFDVLVVNYRGSIGFGQDELLSLHGRAGVQDVEDVARAVQDVISRFGYDQRRCVAVGGSHGGFICSHLVGRFPKLLRAISVRNPPTYIPAMYATSDIPDFVFPESCREDFLFDKTPAKNSLLKMQQLSPTEYVDNVEAPVLLALGAKDLRVPPSQGLLFWKLLNASGKKNRLLWYPEDNHSLDKPATDADYWANTGAWFLSYVSQDLLPPL